MATHIMTAIALNEEELMNSVQLANSLNTNPVVVRRILSELQKAGLLNTQAGRAGGASLARPASAISLHEVFAAVDDGELFAYNPNAPVKTCTLSCEMKSVLEPIFQSATSALADNLKKVKLADVAGKLAKRCREKGK